MTDHPLRLEPWVVGLFVTITIIVTGLIFQAGETYGIITSNTKKIDMLIEKVNIDEDRIMMLEDQIKEIKR